MRSATSPQPSEHSPQREIFQGHPRRRTHTATRAAQLARIALLLGLEVDRPIVQSNSGGDVDAMILPAYIVDLGEEGNLVVLGNARSAT